MEMLLTTIEAANVLNYTTGYTRKLLKKNGVDRIKYIGKNGRYTYLYKSKDVIEVKQKIENEKLSKNQSNKKKVVTDINKRPKKPIGHSSKTKRVCEVCGKIFLKSKKSEKTICEYCLKGINHRPDDPYNTLTVHKFRDTPCVCGNKRLMYHIFCQECEDRMKKKNTVIDAHYCYGEISL